MDFRALLMSRSLLKLVNHVSLLLNGILTGDQARAFEINAMEKAMKNARYSVRGNGDYLLTMGFQ